MLDYLRAFDPIQEKYEFKTWADDYNNWMSNRPNNLSATGRTKASVFESSFQYGAISKHEYSSIMDNLKLVYGDTSLIHNDVLAYHLVERKIVHGFLSVPQLDKMFDEDYFNFEWDMHVGQDFNEHRSDYYRDHFIHQIRDMYMMLVLMEDFGLYHASRSVLSEKTASNISSYVCKKMQLFMADIASPVFRKLSEIKRHMQKPGLNTKDYAEEYFFNYVIKASCILAGLFHDLGYPICHFLQIRNRLSNYNPTMYMVTHNEVGSFDQIASILSPSLLFTLVSLKDIKSALDAGKKGKYDHGAYSAIAFLLQFYNNGIIFSLSPEKQCAIELAAVAIFNHTIEYKVTKEKSKSNYYSLYFRQNPIAFLLRMCDDLQEWDRRYFEVSESSDLMFCEKCHTPLIKYRPDPDCEESGYKCYCRSTIRRPDVFMKRKLYLVSMADTVTVKDEKDANSKHVIQFRVDYNLYKLLMMTNINNTYAKFRFKELVGLQKLLEGQDYGSGISHIEIDFFMSPNPISIKLEILKRFVENTDIWANRNPIKYLNYYGRLSWFYAYPKELLSPFQWNITNSKQEAALLSCIQFYISILRKSANPMITRSYYTIAIDFYSTRDTFYSNILHFLVDDALRPNQRRRRSFEYAEPDKESLLYTYIGAYTNINNQFNSFDKISDLSSEYPYIGYYFDIYLFKEMWKYWKDLSKNSNN